FDIATQNDLIDGFPLDEAAFWARMRWRKLWLTLVLVAVALVGTRSSETIRTAFALYLILLAALSIPTRHIATHAYSTVTLSILTTTAFCILGGDALIPAPDVARFELKSIILVLYLAASALSLTTPRGPLLHFPSESLYPPNISISARTAIVNNVHGVVDSSPLSALFFTYISKITTLPPGFGVADLPLLTASMRASVNFSRIRATFLRHWSWRTPAGVRFGLILGQTNAWSLVRVQLLSMLDAAARYAPAYCMRQLLLQIEARDESSLDGTRDTTSTQWGYIYVAGMFAAGMVFSIGWGQLWNLVHITDIQIVNQTNTLLFMKTLVRKDIAGSSSPSKHATKDDSKGITQNGNGGRAQFTFKSQIFTLMSQDVQRVSELSKHLYLITDSVVQLVLGSWLLYSLLGISCFVGLGATLVCLPLQHFTGKIIIRTQSALMTAKDERITLTNEIISGIRMIKFMAWERNFEARLWGIREKELTSQKVIYTMKTLLTAIGNLIPLLFALASFGHFTVIRHELLTPSIAFTAVIFNGIQYAISGFPETLLAGLQCFVSLRRIDQYLDSPEVSVLAESAESHGTRIFLSSASLTWPLSVKPDAATAPFTLSNLSLEFPAGELSLVCGKVGSGKSLLLLALLGEAEVVSGQVVCPRSAPDFLANSSELPTSEWVVRGVCAYVPQTAWLRNQSIRDNILFELPFCAERYAKTLKVCALLPDLAILEYGDLSEIGERGINLSGGQKARVSLARAVYSRASILLLDDVLSAVDVHTAHHIYHMCLKGDIMSGRTVILVSHHIQLCADGATYVVALDGGTTGFQGKPVDFRRSNTFRHLLQTKHVVSTSESKAAVPPETTDRLQLGSAIRIPPRVPEYVQKGVSTKAPKVVVDEASSVGRIRWDVWKTYLRVNGGWIYWLWFTIILLVASFGPVFENTYLRIWTDAGESARNGPVHYLSIYAGILCIGKLSLCAFLCYRGSIRASRVLHRKLLETVLFASIRFHDTVARGSLLNRFGKDTQIIDGSIADDFGRALKLGISVVIAFITITLVGGFPFFCVALALGLAYYLFAQDYGHTSRDMRRLVSTTFSPLYSVYDTTISGVVVIRSFGASTTFLRDMMRFVDVNSCACHWQWGLNRWFSVISMAFSGTLVALIGLVILLSPSIGSSLAGLALFFASSTSVDVSGLPTVRAFVGLEQCLVAVERVKETTDLPREPPEIAYPRPPAEWPSRGEITCRDFSVRYAPELPDVLRDVNFQISPGEKARTTRIGVVGRTGSGKSTLGLSFFRFVEASGGKLFIDGIDIATLGLTDLRRNLTIIPQDPTLMSGTLRSTLDTFNEYQDAEIFEALRRVHLISDASTLPSTDRSVFNNLESPVSQGGNNFSAGQKQLLCLARAILKHSKVLIIDEATASVDYATDERIGVAIREKFSESTVITIAHRLRSIIDYDKVIVLEQGRIVEFERRGTSNIPIVFIDHRYSPRTLLDNSASGFSGMCKATGKDEFETLRSLAGM
ncbi:multidrug resistance-associated ABC transporter, partial [Mycena pura]